MTDWVQLSKVLPYLVFPFNIVLWISIISIVFYFLNFRKPLGISLCLSLGILLVCGSPISTNLYSQHEQKIVAPEFEKMSSVGAIVLLGGSVGLPLKPRTDSEILGNRALHAFRLYKAGLAKKIIISGGNVFPQPGVKSESFYTARLLEEWGVPAEAVVIEEASRNTYENAIQTKKKLRLIDEDMVLLVTSAFHMPRALATFRTVGINAIPAPASYSIVTYTQPAILDWIPSISNLGKMQALIRENLGILVYRYRGWIS